MKFIAEEEFNVYSEELSQVMQYTHIFFNMQFEYKENENFKNYTQEERLQIQTHNQFNKISLLKIYCMQGQKEINKI